MENRSNFAVVLRYLALHAEFSTLFDDSHLIRKLSRKEGKDSRCTVQYGYSRTYGSDLGLSDSYVSYMLCIS